MLVTIELFSLYTDPSHTPPPDNSPLSLGESSTLPEVRPPPYKGPYDSPPPSPDSHFSSPGSYDSLLWLSQYLSQGFFDKESSSKDDTVSEKLQTSVQHLVELLGMTVTSKDVGMTPKEPSTPDADLHDSFQCLSQYCQNLSQHSAIDGTSSEVDGIHDKLLAGVRYLARKLGWTVANKTEQSAPKKQSRKIKPPKVRANNLSEFGSYLVSGTPDNPPKNRGYALIFTITKFEDHSLARPGGDVDTENLKKTFSHLGYEVKVFQNDQCTAGGVEDVFKSIRKKYMGKPAAYNPHDSFICCFSSHGILDEGSGEEYIVPYDYNKADQEPRINLSRLCRMINAHSCPALATKPKMFFIQAVRGHELPRLARAFVQKTATDIDDFKKEEIHQDSDFLFSFSTHKSNKSVRNRVSGSWYMQELCKVLQSDTVKCKDICSLLTEVHRRVTANYTDRLQGVPFRQCPELTHTLRLSFYFHEQI